MPRGLGIKDKELLESLKGDVAAERIKWDEYDAAIQILELQLRDNPENFRARCDYVVALSEKYRMKEVLDQYQIIEKSGRPAPYWVTEVGGRRPALFEATPRGGKVLSAQTGAKP